MGCCCNVCSKCISAKLLGIGVIILAVAVQWPKYIWHTIGVLLILKAILILAKPDGCGHCSVEAQKAKKKK